MHNQTICPGHAHIARMIDKMCEIMSQDLDDPTKIDSLARLIDRMTAEQPEQQQDINLMESF